MKCRICGAVKETEDSVSQHIIDEHDDVIEVFARIMCEKEIEDHIKKTVITPDNAECYPEEVIQDMVSEALLGVKHHARTKIELLVMEE